MYVVTFYSFKGGVGRTMAMANVGLSLAQAGRRVLLVDFDLEAPGLDTFDLLRPAEPTPGLVDFVTEYRTTRIAPDVKKFVYEPSHPGLDAKVWVMPTGKHDANYGSRLNAIDWSQLYAEENGYLLFEDLKEQWSRALRPDYVFIDSRTGHTDVGGICTRQLPDAVALLFFPNEQNRRGLEIVVRDINRESQDSGRSIQKYFVAANVPDLDDADRILQKEMGNFQKMMQDFPDATIHHYDSLLLLQQTIFTIERPRTKLAREYDRLAKAIIGSNLEDRAVATEFLDTVVRGPLRSRPPLIDERLRKIQRLYAEDGALLYALGQAYRSLGRGKEADQFFEKAAQFGFQSEERLAEKASNAYSAGAVESARQFVLKALELPTKHVFPVESLLSLVAIKDVEFLPKVLGILHAKNMAAEERLYIARKLEISRSALAALTDFLLPFVVTEDATQELIRPELVLCLVGQRLFAEAEALIVSSGQPPSKLEIQDSFNYAMALWGKNKMVPKEVFLRVVGLDYESPRSNANANYFQCLAISNWAADRIEVARDFAARSRNSVSEDDSHFSAWRYLRVNRADFLRDLDLLDAMIATGQGQPAIVSDHD